VVNTHSREPRLSTQTGSLDIGFDLIIWWNQQGSNRQEGLPHIDHACTTVLQASIPHGLDMVFVLGGLFVVTA
jgi:hypothetical protein